MEALMRASTYGLAVMLLASCEGDAEGLFPMDPPATIEAQYRALVRGSSSGPLYWMELEALFWWNHESVDLADDERVVVDVDGVPRILEEHHDEDLVTYRYYESLWESTQPTSFRFSLEGVEGGAPSSTVSLGDDFAIASPDESSTVSRMDGPIVVSWTPGGVGRSVDWHGFSDCAVVVGPEGAISSGLVAGDPGQLTLEIVAVRGAENLTCPASIRLVRRVVGQVDPALASGSRVVAHLDREVTFDTSP
jgi:hypothetical protein